MKVTVLPAPDLSPAHAQMWSRIQQGDPLLTSPYFTPAFVETVASVRDDVFIGVVEDGNDGVGFFPFQRQRGEGVPVAHGVSDFHGLIASPGFVGRADELTRGCGLTAWQFHHVPVDQKLFEPFHRTLAPCPVIELSKGLGANAGGPGTPRIIGKLAALARQLRRDHGPIRFEPAVNDQAALHQLIAWKSAQYRRLGTRDRFEQSWLVRLLEHVLQTRTPMFAGLLSALYAGDDLVALHMGMRSQRTLHYWFPAYATRFSRYSPGLQLLVKLVEWAPSAAIERIDLGEGQEPYKLRVMSGATVVAGGRVG